MSDSDDDLDVKPTTEELLAWDIQCAERLLELLEYHGPREAVFSGDAAKAWHALNDWRSMSQWSLDRKRGLVVGGRDSKWRAMP